MASSDRLPHELEELLLDLLDRGRVPNGPEYSDLRRRHPEHGAAIDSLVATYLRAASGPARTAAAGAELPRLHPTRIGSYRVVEVLGEGGMGVVYRAVDDRLGREVALKCVRWQWLQDEATMRRFEREARAISSIDHPNVCRLFEYGEFEGFPFFAMQLVTGEPLDRLVARAAQDGRPLFESESKGGRSRRGDVALEVMEKIARAVHDMHERGLVHRDLKPGNVMIDQHGEPVVLDLGLVRDEQAAAEGLTLSHMLMGTPAYMAPEQVRPGSAAVGPHTDVYALGAMLYEVLALRPAFAAPSLHDLQRKILRGERPSLRRACPSAPADLELVVGRAMDVDPMRRYASAAAFADDLRRVRLKEPILARPSSVRIRAQRWVQRNPLGTTLLLALAVALFLSLQLLFVTEASRTRLRRHFDRFASLAAVETLRAAESAAQDLYPAWPSQTPRLRAWLQRQEEALGGELARARAVLAELSQTPAEEDDLDPRSQQGLASTLTELVPKLDTFLHAPDGTVASVRARLAASIASYQRSIVDPADRWERAVAGIAAAGGRYAGLEIVPQIGIVPIREDPQSHLWEFYHLTSAANDALPSVKPDGRYDVTEATGIVFVLIPGGTFAMGADRREGPNVDPEAEVDERPVGEVSLQAFFLSKYEITQAQWRRLAGDAPIACHNPGNNELMRQEAGEDAPVITLVNPMENVSWSDCVEAARRVGLELPTEAQWEYACRAGTATVYSWGDDREPCLRFANVADQRTVRFNLACEPWDDGYLVHAPVGTFAANAFGLHDVHGNVFELCRDWKLSYDVAPRIGDGLREPPPGGEQPATVVMRGGSYEHVLHEQRSANRHHVSPDHPTAIAGWRPARRLFATGEDGADQPPPAAPAPNETK